MRSATDPRACALTLLRQWESGRTFADELLHRHLATSRLTPADRRLLVELFYGVLRWRSLLDWAIRQRCRSGTPAHGLDNVLRLGAYQILLLDRIPDHAAVHETVKLVTDSRRRFVNAILRRVVREKAAIELAWQRLEQEDPATAFSHPSFLVQRWLARFGAERTRALLKWNNEPPPCFLRANELRAKAAQLQAALRTEGVVVRDTPLHPLCLEIESARPVDQLHSFQAGFFYVQDPSTLLAVDRLDPQPGETVLDACAAPGGKTTYLAQKMGNQGRIVACDASERRLTLLRQNCRRLGVQIVQIENQLPESGTPFDRILVDVPCSNTGVLRRRVDLRWRIREGEIGRLAARQLFILHAVAPRLKTGGRLVYSTCSLEPEENERVVEAFLASHPDYCLRETRTLWPPQVRMDGAFVAVLERE